MTTTGDDTPEPEPDTGWSDYAKGFEWGLGASRLTVLLPVVILALAAVGSFIYATAVFVHGIQEVVDHPFPVGNKIGLFALVFDLFLIGATLLIAAVGFYELFIGRLEMGGRPLPAWLQMTDLNDLKARVISMLIVVSAVSFVELVVDFPPGIQVLEVGAGIGAVVISLTIYLRLAVEGGRGAGPPPPPRPPRSASPPGR